VSSTRSAAPDAAGYAPVFRTAFAHSANAMMLVDLDRRILAVNDASAKLLGRSPDDLVGTLWATLLDDPEEALADGVWRERVLAGESFGRRTIRRPDGTTRRIDYAMRSARIGDRFVVLGVCLRAQPGGRADRAHRPAPLTAREREVVHLIALGRVTPEICDELHIAPDTVRAHVRNAMAKTGARTRAHLIAIALTDGLLEP
jgi:PAS domain S-box-containing protein